MDSDRGTSVGSLLIGVGLGAAIMYFLDPDRGARRRHMTYDRAGRALRIGTRELRDAAEDAKNHTLGTIAEVRNAREEGPVEDDRLVDRVRAELGHHVEHPRRIEVFAESGRVTLTGYAAADEIEKAERTVKGVRGVNAVTNELVPAEMSLEEGGQAPDPSRMP